MSLDSAVDFCAQLERHGDLYTEVIALVRQASDVYVVDAVKVAELAARKGFAFTGPELCAAWAERCGPKPEGELSDDDLATVAGGVNLPQVSFKMFQPDGTPMR